MRPDLACHRQRAQCQFPHRRVKVCIGEHDRWCLAAQFKRQALQCGAAAAMIRFPVALDPVKEITRTSGEATSASPTSVPCSLTEFTTPLAAKDIRAGIA
ncbi:hypothetical protein GCM10023174_22610 [Chelativorans composti]